MRLENGLSVLIKYSAILKDSPYYLSALVLHPSLRTKHICTVWPQDSRAPALEKVKNLWISYRDSFENLPKSAEEFPRTISSQGNLNLLDRAKYALDEQCSSQDFQDEYEKYIHEDSYKIGKQSPLEWWLEDIQKQRWPGLSQMAIDVLSMPAMSDEPERIFSGARRTISWDQFQMQPESIERRECLKHWKRSGLV